MTLHLSNMHGKLLAFSNPKRKTPEHWPESLQEIVDQTPLGVDGWLSVTYRSREPLIPTMDVTPAESYQYDFVVRENARRARLLLLSASLELVQLLLRKMKWEAEVRSPLIAVPLLVTFLAERREKYKMGTVFAAVDAFGRSLRTIAMYGDDLADADLFHDVLAHVRPYRVQLRDAVSKEEFMTVGSRGEVSLSGTDPATLSRVDEALAFLTKQNYLQWPGSEDSRG